MPLYHTGLLLIRAWVEKGSAKPLRAHMRTTTDVSQGFESERTVTDGPAAVAVVENWLEDVMEAGNLEDRKSTRRQMSTTTWEFKDLMHVPVVSNASAREIGHVHEVLFSPSTSALFGLVVSPAVKNDPLLLVPFSDIRTIGKDAITVEGLIAEPFEENGQAKAISAAGGYRSGMNVMTESGESVGKVDKVTLNDDGTVASYHSTTGFFGTKHDIEPSEVLSGSEEKLIIADNAREGATRTVTAQGRSSIRPEDKTPNPADLESAPVSPVSRTNGAATSNEARPNVGPQSPIRQASSQSQPVSQGMPDNSMFTANEIPAHDASPPTTRESAGPRQATAANPAGTITRETDDENN